MKAKINLSNNASIDVVQEIIESSTVSVAVGNISVNLKLRNSLGFVNNLIKTFDSDPTLKVLNVILTDDDNKEIKVEFNQNKVGYFRAEYNFFSDNGIIVLTNVNNIVYI